MFTRIFEPEAAPKEGDLYKIIKLHGASFEIRYGYYEEIDRHNEPMGIYPDFLKEPVYTDEGSPFVTHMQAPCEHYVKRGRDNDKDCGTCAFMEQGDELIGICKCKKNQKLTPNN